jgi:arabinogalactan oligomer/maltooligosaccharide transport system substrate-binding protein
MFTRSRSLGVLAVAATLAIASCGSDDDSSSDDDAAAEVSAAEESAEEAADSEVETAESEVETAESAATEEESTGDVETSGDTLLIWADDRRVEPLQEISSQFTEATGIELQVELVNGEDMRERVTQAGPAGEGPDIFVGAHDWTGELAANGLIDEIDVSAKADQFVPVSLQGFNFEGRNYAVPYVTEAVAAYRNTDLVPDPVSSWDELTAACEEAAVENCVVVAGGGSEPDAYHNYPFVSSSGGYIFAFDESTGFDAAEVGLDTPEAIEGVTFLQEQVDAGIVSSTDYDTAKNLFLGGDAAFLITGPWELGTMRDQSDVNWDVQLIPEIDGAIQPFVGAQGFYLSSFSEQPLIAQSFLLDFIATDETMQALYDADPRGTAWVSVEEGLTSDPQVQVFAESAGNGVPMPNIPQMASVWGPLGDNLLLVRNGEESAEAAMTTAADAVRSAVSG